MEFVLVTFPGTRDVRIDGSRQGSTGQVMGVQRGTHIFDLANPRDYTPPRVQVPVINTGPATPMVIAFHPAAFGGGVAMAPPVAPVAKSAAKKKATRKKAAKKKDASTRKKPTAKPKKSAAKRRRRVGR